MRHDDLDLVGGEEAAGTRVLAVAKVEVVVVGHGELVLVGFLGVEALLVVSKPVEMVGTGLHAVVLEDGRGGHAEMRSFGQEGAVRERQVFGDNAVECHWRKR